MIKLARHPQYAMVHVCEENEDSVLGCGCENSGLDTEPERNVTASIMRCKSVAMNVRSAQISRASVRALSLVESDGWMRTANVITMMLNRQYHSLRHAPVFVLSIDLAVRRTFVRRLSV